jgi:hypothetical protein
VPGCETEADALQRVGPHGPHESDRPHPSVWV